MPTSNRCKVATKRCKDNKTKPEEPNNQHNLQIFQEKWETEQHQHYYWILERFELLLQIFSTVSVSASVSHTHNLCMWIRFWVQFAKNSHHIWRKWTSTLHLSFCFLLIAESHTASRSAECFCSSALAVQHPAKWGGTMLPDTVNFTCTSPPVDDWCAVLYTS